jgi:2-oxoglutarate ferredoxin oxidoreductase subunit alpha
VDVTKLTRNALEGTTLGMKEKDRCKNMFVLGFINWMYSRREEQEKVSCEGKFGKKPELLDANMKALRAGLQLRRHQRDLHHTLRGEARADAQGHLPQHHRQPGHRLGLIAGAQKAGLDLFYGSYPITPASDILHELSRHKNFGVKTFQAEDEIAAICSAIGASYGGALGVTASSGPGIALKTEAMGLAFMLEIPLVIVNVQRGGPSTGTAHQDRTGRPVASRAWPQRRSTDPGDRRQQPHDCFEMAFEAVQIAVEHMTPVILLTDGYIANGAEPWRFPEAKDLPDHAARSPSRERPTDKVESIPALPAR